MNLDSLSFTLSQISYLVATLTKKNYKQVVGDLTKLVSLHGLEADRHLLQCLFSSVDFSESTSKISAPSPQNQALLEQCSSLLNKPSLLTAVCYITDNPLINHKVIKVGSQFFNQLSKCLRLSAVQEVVFALALRHSSIPEVVNLSQAQLRTSVPALVQSYIDTEGSSRQHEGGLHETTPEVLHLILSAVLKNPKELGLTNDIHTTFLKTLQRDFPKDLVPVVLAPLVYPEHSELAPEMSSEGPGLSGGMLDTSLADLVTEIGYNLTSSLEECRNNLIKLGGRDLSPGIVARILSVMCRTHSGLEESLGVQTPGSFNKGSENRSSWNMEIFIQALKEIVTNLQWNSVVAELDHPEFIIKDRQGLCLLINGIRQGLQTFGFHPDTFPVDQFYKRWQNVEGQFSLMQNILKNSDVFCFADYSCVTVSVDVLKTPPEQDGKELASWRSLNLVELLLSLSECGLYTHVQDLFKVPVHSCPDVLVLALLQISGPITILRQELLTNLIPIFLGNHPNSAIILHHAWHAQTINVKTIIMHAMGEWYARGDCDQTRLSRILDVAQDLKALSMLLNAQSPQSYPFIIDLACLASRREYLKLEKWLSDKIIEHGDGFVMACIKFLYRRCPQIGKTDDNITKVAPLPIETLSTMVLCLQKCMNSVNPDCHEAILTIVNTCTLIVKSRQQQQQPTILRSRGMDSGINPSVFAGQLYNHSGVDSVPGLSSNLAGINLAGPSSSAFNLQGGLGPLVQSPGSPSRILNPGPSNSPFPIMPIQHQGPVGTSSSLVLGVNQINNLGRMGHNPNMDKSRLPEYNLFPEISPHVSKEIEDEANNYFQRIYNHPPNPTLSIDEVLAMLKRFQDSHNKREKEVFNCMLRSLFEEYKFFPQYPDKELHVTAQLFGGIIEKGIVASYVALGLALRFVLEALKKQEGSKMYYFGIAALDRFKSRLKEYHKYCEHVRAIPHFSEFPQHLQEYVEYGLQSMEPPHKPEGPVLPASLAAMLAPPTSTPTVYKASIASTTAPSKANTTPVSTMGSRPSIANATNIDTLLVATEKEEKAVAPPEPLQDKTAFIFNNLSQLNLKQKCDELRELVIEEYYPWLAQYLVMKRASIEFNFHGLYSNFLDTLGLNDILKLVTRETFRNIRVLLRSDKAIANFSDRSLLKNLGHWLGMLTLARNKPILQIDLDLKSLLVEAYAKGQQELLYVVPFVAKVLESCAKSKVFKPPNPWTIALMNVLAELHSEADLKLTLKFEIEVLCKHLEIDVNNLKPSVCLKDPERLRKIEYQLSQPLKKESLLHHGIGNSGGNLTDQELANILPSQQTSSPIVQNNSTTPTSGLSAPPEPRFGYSDIQITGMQAFQTHTVVSPTILLFQTQPQLKALVRTSIERAVQEWIAPVVDRSIKIALQTCEQIIRKDFALDPDENRMRLAAHYMVRNLTAGMAMITCREQLLSAINTHLKQALLTNLVSPTVQQKEMIEQAASVIANDNMELACAFVQKTAVEKAIPEIDKRLGGDYDCRKAARQDGRRFCDPVALTYQAERMPETVRLKVGGISSSQMAVYEEFARNIPGFLPNERDATILIQKQNLTPIENQQSTLFPLPQTGLATDDLTLLYDKLLVDVEQFVQLTAGQAQFTHMNANMLMIRDCLMLMLRNREMAPQALVQKCVESLQDCLVPSLNDTEPLVLRFKEVIIRILKTFQDPRVYGQQWTNKFVTRYLSDCREEQYRYNIDAVDILIKSGLVNVPQYDLALAQCMENGLNYIGVNFAMQLVQLYLIDDRSGQFMNESDLCNTIEMLAKIQTHSRQPPEGLGNIIDILRQNEPNAFFGDRAPMGPNVHIHNGILQVRAPNYEDPPGLVEKTDQLLRDWIGIYHSQHQGRDSTKAFSMFVHQMNVYGILKTDDLITRFFRLSTQLCVETVYRVLAEKTNPSLSLLRPKCYHTLDAFVRLVALLVKHSGDANNTTTKIHLLNKVLGIVAGCLLQDHDTRITDFQQLPYQRIFTMLFLELNAPEPVLEAINFHVLTAYCHTLHILRPSKAAGFCYAWLELVSHRVFMGRMLATSPQQKCWPLYAQLLIDLFKYLAPFLRNAELAKPVTMLYKGTLRVLLVLLHDFPEFLCDYHYGFCDVIPPNCIQMRNLILSAFPRNMRLPDPFTPNLKVDMLQEISYGPRILANIAMMITPPQFKKDLDSYLKARAPVTFLSELRGNLQISNNPGVRYNVQLMNALILYVGTQAIAYIRSKGLSPNMSTIAHSAHMDIFQNLSVDLDTEGRYLYLNAIANQLRYPNSHTHYFSCTLLYLFAEANTEAIQEQITRVLLERLIVNRPHPWGLLITFIELIKNPTYRFWQHEFVHCAPEIEKLFESVARSCMVKSTVQTQEGEIQE
ncbi:CCR4-NOT transcription complex subunit 1 isoform X2 [Leptinotarsa decemlineata]|uniref:CCR4-NOT transcription complex subunit 1 isoform X2 n=1 Tax=Leptinotarsa decemlineata TaxID=7539 RepID=UPI000C255723|nr:CCR4-NOT transcription complex subunit 1 isoform X1 [Leptinotarsa decemlineata]